MISRPVFQNNKGKKLSELFLPGTLLKVGKAFVCGGGAVTNTGLGLHALGADVLLMANVGADEFGRILKENIKKTGCESCITAISGEDTSYTIVIAPIGVDRFFLHDPGCNDTFGTEHVDFEKVKKADHFHFGYPTLMKRFYQEDGKELIELFRRVKSFGLTTSLDLAAVDPESEAACCRWDRILYSVLPYVDFFVPSIEELSCLLDRPRYEKWQELAKGEDIPSILSLKNDCRTLSGTGFKNGSKGSSFKMRCGRDVFKDSTGTGFFRGARLFKRLGRRHALSEQLSS